MSAAGIALARPDDVRSLRSSAAALALTGALGLSASYADAFVLCTEPGSSVIRIRDACKKRERQIVYVSQLGLAGAQGPKGNPGGRDRVAPGDYDWVAGGLFEDE